MYFKCNKNLIKCINQFKNKFKSKAFDLLNYEYS